MLGQLIDGKYRVVRLLGEGGMGAVYEAVHTGTSRRVAIKVILGAEASTDEEMVGRFQREARAAGSIDTQHIVQVLDTGTDRESGLPFMAMEFLSGQDLDQLVQRLGPLSPDLVLRITAQACIGLQKAHEAGVVHRDIKPANLFLARRDGGEIIVKVLDFGIAKIRRDHLGSSEDQGLTRTGSMLGSPLYMSPEQAKGLKSVDHRTDLWSLGAVMYQVLTGRSPHQDQSTLGQLILAICSAPPALVQAYAPWVPPEIAAIVHGALTIDSEQRFQSAQAMHEAILALLPDGFALTEAMLAPLSEEARAIDAPRLALSIPGAALDSSHLSTAFETGTFSGGLSVSAAHSARPRKSPTALVALVTLGLLGAGGLGAYAMLTKQPEEPSLPEAAVASASPSELPSERVEVPVRAPTPVEERRVKLAIVPAEASVEVAGEPAEVSEGHITLQGALGSLHPVKLRLGTEETTVQVAVTEAGAIPASVRLEVRTAKPMPGSPRPARSPASVRERPAPEAEKPKPKGVTIDRTFE